MKNPTGRLFAVVLGACIAGAGALETQADDHPKIDLKKGWKSLFDGSDMTHWETVTPDGDPVSSDTWVVEQGTITRKGKAYLRTLRQYGDFILDLQLKVGPKTNSGIFLRHVPEYAAGMPKYWYNGLLEIQLYDSYGKDVVDTHDCGALYDMVAPSKNTMHKSGEWNRMTITAKGSLIAVVLNGEKILDVDLDDWTTAEMNPDGTPNKYHKPMKEVPRKGFIWLQDHPGSIWFREIFIKEL